MKPYLRIPTILLLTTSVILASCRQEKPNIIKVEFATSECFLPCKHVAISVDSSLNYKFKDDSLYQNQSFVGVIQKQLWVELLDKLKHIDYRSLETKYEVSSSDMQMAELIIYEDGKKVVRFNRQLNRTDKLGLFMRWLDSTQFHVKLKKAIDTLHFGTTYQVPRNRD
jgi:hypothetical protein